MTDRYTHLHVHTVNSLLDGFTHIKDLVATVKSHGSKAVAITDHGVLTGIPTLWREAKEAGIKPIAGIEAYICEDRTVRGGGKGVKVPYYHCTFIAYNAVGYSNLCRLVSDSNRVGFYSKPRTDLAFLAEYNEGLICLTGCIGGWPQQLLIGGDAKGCATVVGYLRDIFGPSRLFLEMQDTGEPEQRIVNSGFLGLEKKLGVRTILTGDSHYTSEADFDLHDTLLCVGLRKPKDDPKRMRFQPAQYHIKSPAEMHALGYPVQSLKSTLAIEEMCEKYDLPRASGLPDLKSKTDIGQLAVEGLDRRFGGAVPDQYWERLFHELEVIHSLGFENYFLVVHDVISYADSRNIFHGWGRGSSAGSLVAYALGITNVDPIRLGLYFERFLNPGRKEPPDIDVDITDDDRRDVIAHVEQQYGEENVAHIATFNALGPRQVVIDVCKALGKDEARAKAVLDALPHDPTLKASDVMAMPEITALIKRVLGADVLEACTRFANIPRNASIHAAGVVIDAEPLDGRVPLVCGRTKGNEKVATQYVYDDLKKLGYEKFDILGVKALRVIRNVAKRLDLDIYSIPLDDPKTYALLSTGRTIAVFQLESWGYREFLKQFRPRNFDDVMMANALYRPGPMKGGRGLDELNARRFKRKPVQYYHPSLVETLESTYGMMIYQEQVMRVVQILAGWTLTEADQMRWAIGKKKKEEVAALRDKFVNDCVKCGHAQKFAVFMFDEIEFFARYGWNKAHAAAYGMVTYATAWLKANYTAEFMAEFLNSEDDPKKRSRLYRECSGMGLRFVKPHINLSGPGFQAIINGKAQSLQMGIGSIKGIGEKQTAAILHERKAAGRFTSLENFRQRIPPRLVNKTGLAALVNAGAMRELPELEAQIDVPF